MTGTHVGFIGLGIMGSRMATRLVEAGLAVTVWNRTAAKMEPLVALGARGAESPAEVAERSDVVITMVTGPADVEEVVLGEAGEGRGKGEGGAAGNDAYRHVDDLARGGASGCRPAGGARGGDAGRAGEWRALRGRDGSLSIMVGGKAEVLERCRPVPSVLGQTVIHCGSHGAARL